MLVKYEVTMKFKMKPQLTLTLSGEDVFEVEKHARAEASRGGFGTPKSFKFRRVS